MTRMLLRVLIVGVLLALIAWQFRPAELKQAMSQVEAAPLFYVLALNVPITLLVTARSYIVLKRLGYMLSPRVALSTSLLGYVAGSLTPGGSGELLRAR